MEMSYTKIDLNEWSRGKLFKSYIENMRIVMSLTVEIDVTNLIEFSKRNNLKFYPSMIWIVSKVVNTHDEFKYSWNDTGDLIKWNFISPSYTEFHKEDENFTKLVTEFSDDIFEFSERFMVDKEKHEADRAFVENQPLNFFDVSCLPWVKYSHFDVHVFDEGKFLAPVITWGKYEMSHGRYMMPLTMNIHHAVADGFHLCRFFNEVQELINTLDGYPVLSLVRVLHQRTYVPRPARCGNAPLLWQR